VNITQVQHGVNGAHAAVSLWSTDSPVPNDALEDIRKAAHVTRAIRIELG